jgi:thymidylate synthase
MENGDDRGDRTGVGTRGVFGVTTRYDLSKGFPAMTTKRLAWKAVVSELLWFIEGSGDERRLAEILHGTRDAEKKTIWTANAEADYWKGTNGDLGRVYGVQWREWRTFKHLSHGEDDLLVGKYEYVDQLKDIITRIKTNPFDRRLVITAWNPGELNEMALPPCHMFMQFFVSSDNKLSCQMYQRSCDMFLGVPFNIASYALLTHMVAQVCDLDVGEFVHTLGDAHIYNNHFDAVEEQLTRTPLELPQLWLNPDIKDIEDFTMGDIKLVDYKCLDTIKAKMAV